MGLVKGFAEFLLFLAGVCAFLRYVGDLPWRQRAVLSFGIFLGCELYASLKASLQPKALFSPFIVSISANWYELLQDFRLINGDEEWRKLDQALAKVPTSEYRIIRSCITFTVIGPPSPDGLLPGLTYSNDHATFSSEELNLTESIMPTADDFSRKKEHPFSGIRAGRACLESSSGQESADTSWA